MLSTKKTKFVKTAILYIIILLLLIEVVKMRQCEKTPFNTAESFQNTNYFHKLSSSYEILKCNECEFIFVSNPRDSSLAPIETFKFRHIEQTIRPRHHHIKNLNYEIL